MLEDLDGGGGGGPSLYETLTPNTFNIGRT